MEKTVLNYDMSLIKFLNLYFGVNPKQAKNITHKDACKLFSLEPLTEENIKKHSQEDLRINYIRVKDKYNNIMYYQKLEMISVLETIECNESEFNEYTEIEWQFIALTNIDISNLTPWQLQELKHELKNIKKYIGKQVDRKIASIDKQLRYIKRRK